MTSINKKVLIESIIILITFIDSSNCLRPPKFISRPKTNCYKNVSNSIEQNQETTRNPRCIALNHPYCLDIKLPYNSTILPEYVPDLSIKSIDEIHSYLHRWEGAKKLPKCWPILQVALCSILMPQCDEDYSTGKPLRTYTPNVDICNDLVARDECKFIERQFDWPTLFNCNDTLLYAKNCTNDLRDLRFSPSRSECQYPLVKSNDESTWFKDIGGCALHCKFPISNLDDQISVSLLIRVMSFIGLMSTLFASLLFWANKVGGRTSRMAKIIRICNVCQFFVYLGWSLQTILNSDIACDSHGSTLYGLPLVANSCVLSFILTYLPSLTSLFWCAHLGKSCHEKLLGKEKSSPDKTTIDGTLRLINYGVPLILFVSVAFLGHIDGHGLYGVCTIGQRSIIIKSIFVFAPTILGTIYGNFYFFQIIYKLAFIKSRKPSIRRNLIRIVLLSMLSLMQVFFTIGNYLYELTNRDQWRESIDRFVACSLNLNNNSENVQECNMDTKPNVHLFYLEITSNLAIGIVIASWAFHQSNYKGLRQKLITILEDEKDNQRRQADKAPNELDTMVATVANPLLNAHDIIDMTSPTHDRSVDLENIRSTDGRRTPSSLASASIAMSVNTDMFTPRNGLARSARDVVNEARQGIQQQNQIDQELVLNSYLAMVAQFTRFNPPRECQPDNQPVFSQGFAQDIQSNT